MANKWNPVTTIGHVMMGVATPLLIICQAQQSWRSATDRTYGLYSDCNRSTSICSEIGWNISVDSLFYAVYVTRCILIACDILVGVGLLCLMLTCCVRKKICTLVRAGTGLYITAGIIITIACIFYTAYSSTNESSLWNYDSSFYLAWVCGPMYVVGASIVISTTSSDSKLHTEA